MRGLQVRRHPASHPGKTLCCGLAGMCVDVSIEVAVGTLVACDTVNQALTCHWGVACRSPADVLVLAVNKTGSSITSVF